MRSLLYQFLHVSLLILFPLSTGFLHSLVLLFQSLQDGAQAGICYGRVADNLPPPSTVISILQSNSIPITRIFRPDPDILTSFSDTGMDLMIGVPNELLPFLANNSNDYALEWIELNILTYIPATQVKYLIVGNEIFSKQPYFSPYVVPSILNLYQALKTLNLEQIIKISTTHASSVLSSSFPPSNGTFDPQILPQMVALLQFLQDTESPFMINVYPYLSYVANQEDIELDYALFRTPNIRVDDGLYYDNLFDATLDSFVAAMEREGFGWIRIMVSETGWPTGGGEAADLENARVYNGNVLSRALGDVGTPRRPGVGVDVLLFDLFDENHKDGEEYERHFGVFGLDGTKAYDINFG